MEDRPFEWRIACDMTRLSQLACSRRNPLSPRQLCLYPPDGGNALVSTTRAVNLLGRVGRDGGGGLGQDHRGRLGLGRGATTHMDVNKES
jgi:hypothetical protein